MTCTGETLAEQVARLAPPAPDQEVIYSVEKPFKDTGGLRLLRGNLAPDGGAILKVAGVEGGVHDGVFTGRARVFNGERDLIEALDQHPDDFEDNDMVVIRYAGPRGAPGHARAARPHLAHHGAVPAAQHHHRPDDRRPLLGGIGRAGHRPRGARGIPRRARSRSWRTGTPSWSTSTRTASTARSWATPGRWTAGPAAWRAAAEANGGVHPDVAPVTDRVLARMRATALPALLGGGMATSSLS